MTEPVATSDVVASSPSSWSIFFSAARPKTLPAAIVPVWTGTLLVYRFNGAVDWLLCVFTLLATLCIQIATNFFNDAVDAIKGTDTAMRIGPRRAAASGLVAPKTMIFAGITILLMATGFSLPLIGAAGWPIVLIGVISLFLAYGYTGGPFPLAYRGLGEIFVILFFGVVAVGGTVFVQTKKWPIESLLLGLQVGLFSAVLIAINNLRDIAEDRSAGKNTLAVRFGPVPTKWMIATFCLLPIFLGGQWMIVNKWLLAAVLPALLLPWSLWLSISVLLAKPSPELNKLLARGALQLIIFALLMTLATVLPDPFHKN